MGQSNLACGVSATRSGQMTASCIEHRAANAPTKAGVIRPWQAFEEAIKTDLPMEPATAVFLSGVRDHRRFNLKIHAVIYWRLTPIPLALLMLEISV